MRKALLLASVLMCVVSCAFAQVASERILSYDSDITVSDSGTIHVQETIRVDAEGERIKHGIYRDFPTHYKDKLGNNYVVPFNILEVSRDGSPEKYRTERVANGVRVYLGKSSTLLDPGEHTYVLIYETSRQIGFFDDYDELYWNVTGNGWEFQIDRASATVTLPADLNGRVIQTFGYTGPQGYTGRDFTARTDDFGRQVFRTRSVLNPREGMTIAVRFEKGFIRKSTDSDNFYYFLSDNASLVAGLVGFIIVLLYQVITWFQVGRDPKPGIIMPLYTPPTELSPAGMRELVKMKFDNKAFAADLLSLASKKYLTIEQDEIGTYTVSRTRDPKAEYLLNAEEKLIAARLFTLGDHVLLSPVNRATISEAINALRSSLAIRLEKIYFVSNSGYVAPSVLLTLATYAAMIWYADTQLKPVAAFITVWLSIWSLGVVMLSAQAYNIWKQVLRGGKNQSLKAAGAIGATLFALPFILGELFGLGLLAHSTSAFTVILFATLVASNFLYHELLKAPTHMGRALLDKIQGFKMFLAATEGDQIQRLAPVQWNSDTFNMYLPYAVALGVEHQWAEKFAHVLAVATVNTEGMSGAAVAVEDSAASIGAAAAFGDALTSAISSSSTPPGSTSGSGGGGSSGGGGGGGGGGGW